MSRIVALSLGLIIAGVILIGATQLSLAQSDESNSSEAASSEAALSAGTRVVWLVDLDGPLGPASGDLVSRSIEDAQIAGAEAIGRGG